MQSVVLLLALACAALAAPVAQPNIIQLAEATPDLSTLVKAVSAGGLVTALEGPGPFTVFAPTNEAFAALPAGVLDHLLQPENIKELQDVLEYHVVAGARVYAAMLKNREQIKMLNGQETMAFLAHGEVYINYAKVITANVNGSNGVVHIVDHVLVPREVMSRIMTSKAEVNAAPTQNIVQLAQSTPDLSTLVTAVVAGGLASTLSGPGPFTVFAPTNEAFAALPAGVLQHLLQPENKGELDEILLYHVIAGVAAKSSDLKDREEIKTAEGASVTVYLPINSVYIDYAEVTAANILATNGVVHIIDSVLVPPAAAKRLGML